MNKPKKAKVLIVDDESDLLQILEDLLVDYDVIRATNGKEGLKKVLTEKPQAVITDITMPEMTGIEMLMKIRETNSDLPVIILTGFADVKNIRQAWKLGAFDFLDKPFEEEMLLSLVKNAVEFGNPAASHAGIQAAKKRIA